MLGLLNCVYIAWYEWHEITENSMKYNPVRIMYDLRTKKWETIWYEWWTISETIWKMIWYVHNTSRVVVNDNENGKILGRHALCVLMHWGIPLFHHEGTDAYIQWQDNDRYFCIALPWRLLVLTGVQPKELPKYARPTRKVAQRCANWLVSPYSHVWAVCRVYGTHPNYPLEQHRRKTDWKIGLIISFACNCCI